MKKIVLILLLCVSLSLSAQHNARYGSGFAPYGLFRVLTVFADVVDDTVDYSFPWWNEGELPDIADQMFEHQANGRISKYVTKYFYEASFGSFLVLSDYYPRLVMLHHNDFTDENIIVPVINYLHSTPANDTLTQHGYGFSSFDRYSFSDVTEYSPTYQIPDNRIDMLNIIWRRNKIKFATASGGNAVCYLSGNSNRIKNFTGINGRSNICYSDPGRVFRHEFSHTLIGENNYHTGGAGTLASGTFLSNIGGYSMLSSYNANLDSYNGWDRWWLGWKHPNKQYYISALNTERREVDTDLEYGDALTENVFILRNFADFGDVIRIKLPYLKDYQNQVRNQYLWIENHQIKQGTIEYESGKAKGIRFNIQVGNDDLERDFEYSRTNYYVPLSAFGNHDFRYSPFDTNATNINWFDAYTTSQRANPFTGYHPSMLPAIDVECGQAHLDDKIQSNEFVTVHRIYKDGESACGHLPVFGNSYDAFPVGFSLRLASNPPSTPLLTYKTSMRKRANGQNDNPSDNSPDDNRHIWLNGLRVDILEEFSDGSIKVRIVWNDYDIDNNVRWCGPLVLSEKIILNPARTLLLDYGLMPTRPNNPVLLGDDKVFSDPTSLTCRNGSLFKQESNSKVTVANQSIIILESGSVYEIKDGATLDIRATGTLLVKSGATLRVKGSGHIEVQDGGYICFEDGANIKLENTLSVVNLHDDCIQGINPVHSSISADCFANDLTEFLFNGQGAINVFNENNYIQNRTYTNDAYETGAYIRSGHHVTNQIDHGNVVIENGANVIFDAEKTTTLEEGTEVKAGGSLIVR